MASLFALKKFKAGEKAIEAADRNIQWYIALTGQFRAGNSRVLPGGTFGSLEAVSGEKWKPAEVAAAETSSAIVMSPHDLSYLISQENANRSYKSLISFLCESIPKFSQISGSLKYRLAKLFVEKTFAAGREVLSEGTVSDCAYLIKEGRCKIFSKENPLDDARGDLEADLKGLAKKCCRVPRKANRGYISLSTCRYQINTVGNTQWLNDEILLESPRASYSAVAVVRTAVLAIAKESLNKFPSDVINEMKRNTREKLQWRKERTKEVLKSVVKISQLSSLPSEKERKLSKNESRTASAFNATCFTAKHDALCNSDNYRNTSVSFSMHPSKGQPRILIRQRKLNNDSEIDSKSMINTNASNKRVLEFAAMFKAFGGRKFLRPAVTYKPYTPRIAHSIKRLNSKETTKASEMANKKFIVGVREVRVMSIHSRKAPPSPNLLRIGDAAF